MLFGFSDEELYAFCAAGGRLDPFAETPDGFEAVGQVLALIRDLHAAKTTHSISHVVDRLVRSTGLRELLAADGGGAQASGNLDKLIELADAFSAEEDATFHAYVRKLGELQSRAEEGESPVGEAGEFVRLMSIHKAKGLEFPIVVLADTGAQPRSVAYNDVVVDRGSGRLLFGISVDPPESAAKAERCHLPGDEALRALEGSARGYEGRRLLYVAATRAKDRLVIPLVADAAPSKGSFLEQLSPFLVDQGGPADKVGFVATSAALSRHKEDEEAPPVDLIDRREVWGRARRKALEAAALPAAITSPSRLELLDPPDAGTWEALPSNDDALALGHLVHRGMELVALGDVSQLAVHVAAAAHEMGRPDLAARAEALASACWASGPVRAAAACRHWREVPVSAAFDDILVEGYIDLLYEVPNGLVVVDFKTDKDGDAAAAERRYALQLGAYAVSLERATGLRVVEAWVVMAAGDREDGGGAPAGRIVVDDSLRDRVRSAAREAARAGLPLVETMLP